MSLTAEKIPLSSSDKVKLLEWLRKPEFDILRRVLEGDAAFNEVEATKLFEKSIQTPRMADDGVQFLVKATEAEITLKKLETLLKPDAEAFTVKISTSLI